MHTSINKFIFKGNPNEIVIDRDYNRELFKFDENGEFITDNLRIVGKAVGHFDYLELKDGMTGFPVEEIPFTDETVLEEVEEAKEEVEEEVKLSKCKKCGMEFENKGEFLAHSRKCKGDVE